MRFGRIGIFALALTAWGCAGGDTEVEGLPTPGVDGAVDSTGGGDETSTPEPDTAFVIPDGGGGCIPKVCADFPAGTCGPQSDGCGGTTKESCGECVAPEICGGGGPSKCGVADTGCKPKTCAELGANCGPQGDGCGGTITSCGTCTAPETCGGGGTPSVCGKPPTPTCTPKTCTEMGLNCGPAADGCGTLANCGTCTTGTCGGGGVPNVCGSSTSPCVKKTCADWGANCGQVSDGCGGLTASCGTCSGGNICGGGGTASVCGGAPPACTPKTCADYPTNCGPMPDGCGGVTTSCNLPCPTGQSCGGGGVASVCGGPPACVKKTCADYPMGTCGAVSDGCGDLTTNCGGCTSPQICGGGGVPSQCGGGGGTSCLNLECKQVTCIAGLTSSISGKVYDPAGRVPLYNVFVYIPNGTPTAFTPGATCDKCADALSGYPLVQTVTDEAGNFRLTNVPVGTDIPLVIQTGKWRRQVKITTRACIDTPIDATLTRFPRTKAEGDIPQFAITSGSQDNLECLMRKIGIADSEFTAAGGTGRVHLYTGFCGTVVTSYYVNSSGTPLNCPKDTCPTGVPCIDNYCAASTAKVCGTNKISYTGYSANLTSASTTLWNSTTNLAKYDAVLMDCEGGMDGAFAKEKAPYYKNMFDYAGLGGRVFGSHYHLQWVKNGPTPWPGLATWNLGPDLKSPTTATVLTTFPKGNALATWLVNVGASGTRGVLSIQQAQHSIDAVNTTNVTNWITAYNQKDVSTPAKTVPSAVEYMSFNTPVGSTSQCGRVVLSDIHVDSSRNPVNDSSATAFPARCGTDTTLTPQQKALEFMIFDLGSRVCDEKLPPPPPTCTKSTCATYGIDCGSAPDGCGGTLACGTCPSGQVCSTGGKCAGTSCTPTTCAALAVECGSWANGCGGILNCGDCTLKGGTCGGSGVPGKCGGATCTPKKCTDYGYDCGSWSDGCGGVLNCGTCLPPASCGGTGVPGKCGGTGCVKKTCAELGVTCGLSGDGCGGTQDCGPCDAGTPTCTPLTCGGRCGLQGDGCGGILTCPACEGGTCTKTTCGAAGAECGSYPDGCGGLLDCGTCVEPKKCGAGGPNKCGTIG